MSELTESQKEQLPIYRDKWIEIGTNTDPIDEDRAREAIRLLYECGDQTPPSNVMFFESPKQIIDHLKTLPPFKSRSNSDLLQLFIYGQHDASWLTYYDYLKGVVYEEDEGKLAGLIACAKQCGWIVPLKDHCFVSAKLAHVRYNADGQIHAEKSPALEYPDGWGVAVFQGQQIPLKWLENPPSASEMLSWPNVDQRQAGCELLGWHNILEELDSVSIDKHENPEIGELLKVTMVDPEDSSETSEELFLRYRCPTQRTFATLVTDSQAQTAQQAQNWMQQIPEGLDYAPAFRQ
jgi:hypothetical protein